MRKGYDAVIIGAGMSGLTCGCYLAKKGLKTLVVERNKKCGGYCMSFEEHGYRFDLGVHSVGSLKEGGILSRIFGEIGILDGVKAVERHIANTVIMPDLEIDLYSDHNRTLSGLKDAFPKESSRLDKFFNALFEAPAHSLYNEFKDKSYSSVLERHFRDSRIRAIFGILAGSSAVSPRDLSAFIAMMMTREFIFKGAYNIKGGDIQVLPDAIRKKIVSFGGEVLTGSEVEKIMVKDTKVRGVSLKDRAIESRYVVSASDAHSTFEDLLKSGASGEMKKRLKGLATTSSAIVFYFGLRPDLALRREGRKNFWYCPSYGSVERLPRLSKDVMDIKDKPVFFYLPDSAKGPVVIAIINVGYRDNAFWDRKTAVIRTHILKAMNRLFGASESDIVTEGRRTPHDLFLLTKNHNGAIRGWASTPRQSSSRVFPQRTHLRNMFCTGHWTTSEFGQGGISNSINAARRTYEMILREERP